MEKESQEVDRWSTETLYYDGDQYFAALCDDLSKATHSIQLETYIFNHDPLGKRIAGLLEAAAARGVRVHVIVDGFGSPLWQFFFGSSFKKAGIAYKVFHRIPFDFILYFPLRLPKIGKAFTRLGRRDHRKLCVIDHSIAWVGSLNIAAYHLKEFAGTDSWRDTGVRLTGTAVQVLRGAFDYSWRHSVFTSKRFIQRSPIVRIYYSRGRQRLLYEDFLQKLRSSQRRIWFTTAYFVPTLRLLFELRRAVARNVDVRVLTTIKTDAFIIRWFRSMFYFGLLKAGVKIFEYKPTVLHAKSTLIDDYAIVGSTNLNHRSFFQDLEVDVVLSSVESMQSLERQYLLDLAQSETILAKNWKNRAWLSYLLGKIAALFRNWL